MTATRRLLATTMAIAVGCAALAGCDRKPPAAAPAVPRVFDLAQDAAASIPVADPTRTNLMPAAELRLSIERVLGWHVVSLVKAMRATRSGAGADEWVDALVANTDDVVDAIGLAYGRDTAKAFHQQWAQHAQFLVDYAAAVGRQDRTAADVARRGLADFATDAASFLATMTDGQITAEAATKALSAHVVHMVEQLDALGRGDVDASTRLAVGDHADLVTLAGQLAAAIAARQPMAFIGSTDTPLAAYCSVVNVAGGAMVIDALSKGAPPRSAEDVVFAPMERAALPTELGAGLDAKVLDFEAARTGDDASTTIGATTALLVAVDYAAHSSAPAS